MYAETTLTLEARDNVLAVPLEAVSREGDQTSVDVVSADNKVEVRPISVGLETSTDAEIVSGLAEGESVVASDRSGLKPDESVSPQAVQMLQYHGGQGQ
jgi:multidrug efflux pump subunit AcrA (membrane-fusion protein)